MKIKDHLLSLSGVILGILLSAADYHVNLLSATNMVLTIIFLHSYSVSTKSTPDNKLKSRVFLALTILCGLAMLHFSFGSVFLMEPLLLMVLGYVIIRTVSHMDFREELRAAKGNDIPYVQITREIVSSYPAILEVHMAQGARVAADSLEVHPTTTVIVKCDSLSGPIEIEKLHDWLKIRLNTEEITLIQQ